MGNPSSSSLTLQEFLQPPALASEDFGGLHFHVHSKDTKELPFVV